MARSLDAFLEEVARRGSWLGGGTVAAVSLALAAALVEKLAVQPAAARRLRRIRRECLRWAEQDAQRFANVIEAMRQDGHRFPQALRAATEIPWHVFQRSHVVQGACRAAQRSVNARFHSDLRCAMALAQAAGAGAHALIETNLTWLKDRRYTRTMRRRLAAARASR